MRFNPIVRAKSRGLVIAMVVGALVAGVLLVTAGQAITNYATAV
ncbi:hypothetical protein [uncultured Sphingomonas sp.]|jgi:hypothetical protein|nr:hypothetical protein [uncultured Sphingomonas sp.]